MIPTAIQLLFVNCYLTFFCYWCNTNYKGISIKKVLSILALMAFVAPVFSFSGFEKPKPSKKEVRKEKEIEKKIKKDPLRRDMLQEQEEENAKNRNRNQCIERCKERFFQACHYKAMGIPRRKQEVKQDPEKVQKIVDHFNLVCGSVGKEEHLKKCESTCK